MRAVRWTRNAPTGHSGRVAKLRKQLFGTWIVHSPQGRKFVIRAEPMGVPSLVGGVLSLPFFLLGRLWHWLRHRGWRVKIVESAPLRVELLKWMPPPPTTWLTAEFPTKQAALNELDRVAVVIEEGTWPPHA